MNQPDGIKKLGNHLLGDAGAVVVIIGKQAETGVEPSAAFAGFNQGDVEFRQPAAELPQRLGEGAALGIRASSCWSGSRKERPGGLRLICSSAGNDADAGGRELGELMIKLGALGELAGRDDAAT